MKYHINFKKCFIMLGLLLCFTAGCADSAATDGAATVSSDAVTVSVPQATVSVLQDTESAPQDTGTVPQDMGVVLQQSDEEPPSQVTEPSSEAATPSPPSILEVHFIDVGQGDSILITCDGEAMLIDAGDDAHGTAVQFYLKKQGVNALKYVVGTHSHADHIGGMDVILYKFDCETVVMPGDTVWKVADTYSLGSAVFTILGPMKQYTGENDNSVVLRLVHGQNSFLLAGDAEREAESDMLQSGMELHADVLKVGHHGSITSSGEDFLDRVQPRYAVISCGAGNPYGVPYEETLEKLRQRECRIFRTDELGSIVVRSDGDSLEWIYREADEEEVTYILNTNTKKFHAPDCLSVVDIKERNKIATTATREEIIEAGYAPCKRCNP